MAQKPQTEDSELNLSRKNLYQLQPYLTKKRGIKRLNLIVNMLTSLPPELINMHDLEEIACSNNQFENIPVVVCKLVNLILLDFAGNRLKDLPSSIVKLTKLTKVFLGWNNFSDFPAGLCKPRDSALTELHLSNNNISSIPEKLSNLRQLKIFDISHNNIKFIPTSIGYLINLTSLDVSYNDITNLPDDICELQRLKTLKASTNHITALPHHFGASLHQLTLLNVEGNPLEDPPIDICQQGITAIKIYQDGQNSSSNSICTTSDRDDVSSITSADQQDNVTGSTTERQITSSLSTYGNLDQNEDHILRFSITPNITKTQLIKLSDKMKFEIPPNAVSKEVIITARVLNEPSCPVVLADNEFIVTDFLQFTPDGFLFQKPIIFMCQCPGDLRNDGMREFVVRTTNDNGTWNDLSTWQEDDVFKAEVEHFSELVAVSKVKQHSVILSNIETIRVSCNRNDISVDVQTPHENQDLIHIVMERQCVDRDTLLRACELVGGYQDDYIAVGTILKLQQDGKALSKPIALSLQVPELRAVSHMSIVQLRKKGLLRVIRDYNDHNWRDITNDVIHDEDVITSVSFTEPRLHWPASRYATIITEPGVNVEAIAQMATRMSSKGWQIVNLILLQNVNNPKSLYVDCVNSEKLEPLLSRLQSSGYEARGTLPYTRDIDLAEGEMVDLHVAGEYIKEQRRGEKYLTFYSRRDNHIMLHVSLTRDAFDGNVASGDDCTGHVDFLKTQNKQKKDIILDTLWFGIPKPENISPMSPISGTIGTPGTRGTDGVAFSFDMDTQGVDSAIQILTPKLGRDWKRLGRTLTVSDPDLAVIESNDSRDLEEQIYQMFRKWKQKEGNRADIYVLVEALKAIDRCDLAHTIKRCCGLGQSSTRPKTQAASRVVQPPSTDCTRSKTQLPLARKATKKPAVRKALPVSAVTVQGPVAGLTGPKLILYSNSLEVTNAAKPAPRKGNTKKK
ncbi:p53-induced death domain-containing protein 1-like [Saccoglossus kowalevskii]